MSNRANEFLLLESVNVIAVNVQEICAFCIWQPWSKSNSPGLRPAKKLFVECGPFTILCCLSPLYGHAGSKIEGFEICLKPTLASIKG